MQDNWTLPAYRAYLAGKKLQNGSRSSKRTDVLNTEFIELLKSYFLEKDWDLLTEQKMNCSRGRSFKVDILARNKKNPDQVHVFLLKSVQSSYNKNRHNYGNTTIGEAMRLLAGDNIYKNSTFNWISWIPFSVPTGLTGFETPIVSSQDSELKLLQHGIDGWGHLNCKITSTKIRYDLLHNKEKAYGWDPLHKLLESLNG